MAARGDNAATQLHREDAARYYDAAAEQLPPMHRLRKPFYLTEAGDMRETSGNSAAALKSYRDSLTIRDRLAQSNPGNAGWQRDLALSCGRVALIEMRQGFRDDALTAFRQGRDIIVQLTRRLPDNVTLLKDLVWFDNQMRSHDR